MPNPTILIFLDPYTHLPTKAIGPFGGYVAAYEYCDAHEFDGMVVELTPPDDQGDDLLHIVDFTETGFSIQHPLIERATLASLLDCPMHDYIKGLLPEVPGRYVLNDDGTLTLRS